MAVTGYEDALSGKMLVYTGLSSLTEYDECFQRPYRLIRNGMLLQLQARYLDYRKILRNNGYPEEEIDTCEEPERPDLPYIYGYDEFPPYTEKQLRRYMGRFTDKVLPHLDLEQESVDYIKENLNEIIDYLATKLADGHLRFFKNRTRLGPEDGAAIAFGDFTKPWRPIFTYPAFGLKAKTCARGYIPWKPCHLREPEVEPVIDQKPKEKQRHSRVNHQRKKGGKSKG